MRTRLALVAAVALAAPVALASPAHAGGCVTTTRVVYGRLGGADRRNVNAMLGFVLKDKFGRYINARTPGASDYGCPAGLMYGVWTRINATLPATGSATTGTKDWSVRVPTNVVSVHIEVYPKNPDSQYDDTRYGWAHRWDVKIPYGTSINIRLPVVCAQGGTTGHVSGVVYKNGVKVKADRVAAWSTAPDNNTFSPIKGWRVGTARSDGTYVIPNLESGQEYTVKITLAGKTYQRYHIYVNKCAYTHMNASFS
jgi:hypothetical protein